MCVCVCVCVCVYVGSSNIVLYGSRMYDIMWYVCGHAETATTTTMSSIIYPTMTSVPGPLSVVVTMVTTSLPSNTIIIRSGNVPITGTEKGDKIAHSFEN